MTVSFVERDDAKDEEDEDAEDDVVRFSTACRPWRLPSATKFCSRFP
jgi:hypothetical protein